MRDCAEEASRMLLDRFPGRAGGQRGEMRRKGRGNFVTERDLAVESAVLQRLRGEFPEHALLSEEGSGAAGDWKRGWLWLVDPLDGTHNYSQGNPVFSFTIALCHDGAPLLGLNGIVMKAHGSANARAIMNAIRVSTEAVQHHDPS